MDGYIISWCYFQEYEDFNFQNVDYKSEIKLGNKESKY